MAFESVNGVQNMLKAALAPPTGRNSQQST